MRKGWLLGLSSLAMIALFGLAKWGGVPLSVEFGSESSEPYLPSTPTLHVSAWIGDAPDADSKLPLLIIGWESDGCDSCVSRTAYFTWLHDRFVGRVNVIAYSTNQGSAVSQLDDRLEELGMFRSFPVARSSRGLGGTYEELLRTTTAPRLALPYAWLSSGGRLVWQGPAADALPALDEVSKTGDARLARRADTEVDRLIEVYAHPKGASDRARAERELLAYLSDRPTKANHLAYVRLTKPSRDAPFALKLARAAYETTRGEDETIGDTYALALWETGDKQRALEVQRKVMKQCGALRLRCRDERKHFRDFGSAETEPGQTSGATGGASASGLRWVSGLRSRARSWDRSAH